VITVPAQFQNPEREATRRAGLLAGLSVTGILNEPTAAAIAHGVGHDERGAFLVFDLGGGTFDITIMRPGADGGLEVVVSDGDRQLGGRHWDQLLHRHLLRVLEEEHGVQVPGGRSAALLEEARQAKIRLTAADHTLVRYRHEAGEIKIPVARDRFEKITGRLTTVLGNRCRQAMDKALEKGLPGWSSIRKVVLAGGAARMPAIRKLVKDLYPDAVPVYDEAFYDLAVAKGAALYGRQVVHVVDVAPKTLAVKAIRDDTEVALKMIGKNTPLPAQSEGVLFTAPPQARIEVMQGDGDSITGYRPVGLVELNNAAAGTVRVTYGYDTDGLIRVRAAFDGAGGEVVVPITGAGPGALMGEAFAQSKARVDRLLAKLV
jgi:molecular chaperone DnaK